MTSTGRYPGFRAPQGDGETLCVPSQAELPELVARNRQRPELESVRWFGQSLCDIAHVARKELIEAAVDYTSQYTDIASIAGADRPLIVTGHQAELFHPGVWLKNFFAARLAKECGGIALNLIIDSDLCRGTAIRVPIGTDDDLHFETVPYDQTVAEVPFEERTICDQAQWESFGTRARNTLHSRVARPLIEEWWPTAINASHRAENLAIALSQARHQRELEWGSRSLELPQSHVCRSEAFRLFALQLFMQAAEFREAHNGALADYRTAHKLRNHAQPMPNLTSKDGWIETPFWLWSSGSPRRRGVFIKRTGGGLTISDLGLYSAELPFEPGPALERLAEWERQGVKLRTRALGTTLFARLVFADLFIHGIGGAKYDQVTDHICELFFGIELPRYATVSGTLRLPLGSGGSLESESTLRQRLWALRYHPECFRGSMQLFQGDTRTLDSVMAGKRRWIEATKTRTNAAERHQAINQANELMRPWLEGYRVFLEQAVAESKRDAKSAQLRNSREYAYCLFPEKLLREFFQV